MPTEDEEQFEDAEKQTDEGDAGDFEELPPITTLTIDVKDARGVHYHGSFVFKVPNLRDEMAIGHRKSLLLPVGVVNDANALMLAEMIAYLDVTIQKGEKTKGGFEKLPSWWKPMEFYDPTPLTALYKEATEYARRFRNDPDPFARQDDPPAAKQREDADRGMVDGDVPPAEQRRTLHSTDTAGSPAAGAARRGNQG